MSRGSVKAGREPTKKALKERLRLFELLIETIPSPIFFKDERARYLGCNRAYEQFVGMKREALIGKTVYDVRAKEFAEVAHAANIALLKNPGAESHEVLIPHADGTTHEVVAHNATFLNSDGSLGGLVGVMMDITELRQVERLLRNSEERFREIVENAPVAIGTYDSKGRPVYFNGKFTALLRYRIDDIPTFGDWMRRAYPDEEQRKQAFTVWAEDIRHLHSGQVPHSPVREYHFTCGDGVVRDIEVSFSLVADHFYVVFNDVTERNRAEHQLREVLRVQALRDPVTSLFNRRYLDEILESEFSRAARIHGSIGIVMADIDHFKRVNDSFGHDCGDEVLRVVARFLREQLRKSDIVCRYGGEEFTIVMPGAILEEAHRRTASICAAIRDLKILCGERAVGPVTMSFGVAALPQHGDAPAIILKAADAALLRAKMEGRDQVIVAGS
ncbi:MAG TPA: diguanylate cyclase [Alphaproteobacteria bacterium]|nr:diguanylate cyclase [Alphaproteobacteria bacterium]